MNKSTVILIDPKPVAGGRSPGHIPIALLHLGSYLQSKNTRIVIVDCVASEDHEKEILNILPDALCVGFTCYTTHIPHVQYLIRLIKKNQPGIPVILGGYHPSLYPENTLQEYGVDYAVVQEGEEVLLRIVRYLKGETSFPDDLPGLAYKDSSGRIRCTKPERLFDFRTMPPYDYGLIKKEVIRCNRETGNFFPLITSKGCPYKCAFCINVVTENIYYRAFPAERVRDELVRILEMGMKKIWIWDENFYVSRRRLFELIDLMEKDTIYAESWSEGRANYFRENYLNPDFLKRMRARGFTRIGIGCESGSQKMLDYISKEITTDDITRAAAYLAESGIRLSASFMIGLPGEEKEDIFATLRMLRSISEISPRFGITGPSLFRPYPGSELYNECIAAGWKAPVGFDEWAVFLKRYYTGIPTAHDYPWIKKPYLTNFVHFYTFTAAVSFKNLTCMLKDYFRLMNLQNKLLFVIMLTGLLGISILGKLRLKTGFFYFLFEKKIFTKYHPNLEY